VLRRIYTVGIDTTLYTELIISQSRNLYLGLTPFLSSYRHETTGVNVPCATGDKSIKGGILI